MKKRSFFAVLLALLTAVVLPACGDDNPSQPEGPSTPETPSKPDPTPSEPETPQSNIQNKLFCDFCFSENLLKVADPALTFTFADGTEKTESLAGATLRDTTITSSSTAYSLRYYRMEMNIASLPATTKVKLLFTPKSTVENGERLSFYAPYTYYNAKGAHDGKQLGRTLSINENRNLLQVLTEFQKIGDMELKIDAEGNIKRSQGTSLHSFWYMQFVWPVADDDVFATKAATEELVKKEMEDFGVPNKTVDEMAAIVTDDFFAGIKSRLETALGTPDRFLYAATAVIQAAGTSAKIYTPGVWTFLPPSDPAGTKWKLECQLTDGGVNASSRVADFKTSLGKAVDDFNALIKDIQMQESVVKGDMDRIWQYTALRLTSYYKEIHKASSMTVNEMKVAVKLVPETGTALTLDTVYENK